MIENFNSFTHSPYCLQFGIWHQVMKLISTDKYVSIPTPRVKAILTLLSSSFCWQKDIEVRLDNYLRIFCQHFFPRVKPTCPRSNMMPSFLALDHVCLCVCQQVIEPRDRCWEMRSHGKSALRVSLWGCAAYLLTGSGCNHPKIRFCHLTHRSMVGACGKWEANTCLRK